jgi:UDP-GlcNAc:undecaprenyl-phosphate GlcNAc-1-phosphate transferase
MLYVFMDAVASAAALVICLNAETVADRLGVVDLPDKDRKLHDKATPLVGGIAILISLLIWLSGAVLTHAVSDPQPLYMLLICASGVGLVGFADDQTPITPLSRILFLMVFLAAAFVITPRVIVDNLNWGSFEPTPFPPWAFCALISLTTIGIVNAVNMADGQNGLVSSMFVIWSACLAIVGDPLVSSVAQVLALASLVVLAFNITGKLFLGDCGSYGVTFALGLLLMLTYAEGRVTIETVTVWFYIPVADCIRLMITRRLDGRSAMAPDTNHFHHRLQAKLGKTYGLFAYIASVGTWSLVAALVPQFALVCIIVLTAIYFSFAFLTDPIAARLPESAGAGKGEEEMASDPFANVVRMSAGENARAGK